MTIYMVTDSLETHINSPQANFLWTLTRMYTLTHTHIHTMLSVTSWGSWIALSVDTGIGVSAEWTRCYSGLR